MRALLLVGLMSSLALAGCLSDDGGSSGTQSDDSVMPEGDHPVWVIDGGGNELPLDAYPGDLPVFDMRYVTERISGEPTLGVTRHGSLVFAAIDFDQSLGATGQPYSEYLRSWDQGKTWTDISPDILEQPSHPITGDPYVHVDPDTGRIFVVDMGPHVSCNTVSWSDNEGKTWSLPRYGACPIPVSDHPTLFTGPKVHTAGAALAEAEATCKDSFVDDLEDCPGTYPNTVYLCSNQVAQAKCAYSLNGGYDWEPAVLVFPGISEDTVDDAQGVEPDIIAVTDFALDHLCSGFTSHGTTDRNDGTVYVPRLLCGVPYISISRDGGLTYEYGPVTPDEPEFYGEPGVHDSMVAVDAAGNVYYFWLAKGGTAAYLMVSHDQGMTWDAPLDVTAPGLTGVRFPGIVAGEDGRIAFLYMGTDNPRGLAVGQDVFYENGTTNATNLPIWENATWNAYIGYSLDAASEDPVFAITTANDVNKPLKRGACDDRCPGNGREGGPYDFLDIEMDPITGQVFAALVDVCTGFCDGPGVTAHAPQRSFGAVGVQLAGTRLTDGTEYDRP